MELFFRKEDSMKKLHSLFFLVCIFALAVSFSIAAGDQLVASRDGVQVRVQIDPQGPNNWIKACIAFINENEYRVDVDWRPIITCESGHKPENVFVPFSIDAGGTYWVNIGRFGACGNGRIKNIDVEISVKKSNP
jgi:hypothetical protein